MYHCSSYPYQNVGGGVGCSPVMKVLKCVCACSMMKPTWTGVGGGAGSSSDDSSIVRSSSFSSDELAGKPAFIRRARQSCQPAARAGNSCFCSVESLSHIALKLAVMVDVVHGGGTGSDVVQCGSRRATYK